MNIKDSNIIEEICDNQDRPDEAEKKTGRFGNEIVKEETKVDPPVMNKVVENKESSFLSYSKSENKHEELIHGKGESKQDNSFLSYNKSENKKFLKEEDFFDLKDKLNDDSEIVNVYENIYKQIKKNGEDGKILTLGFDEAEYKKALK